jgi:hypothetical protein
MRKEHAMPATTIDPYERECLRCYLTRTLRDHGCDGTKSWTTRWRDRRWPQASDLFDRLADRGGCCCDCEMIFNVWADPDESIDPARRGRCQSTDHPDPLVPCTAWSVMPESEVMPAYEPGDDSDGEPQAYDEVYW